MLLNLKKLLNLEIPKNLESVIQEQTEKTFLRALNGLEIAIKKDIRPNRDNARKLLYQEKYVTLYHYYPKRENIFSVPVILVPPLMSTTDLLDLTPSHSLAETLLDAGFNVYLVDFGRPDRNDSHLKIDDYILNFLYRAVHMTKKHSNSEQVSLLGYCLGGAFSIIYSSVSIDIRNDIKNVINIAGPIDLSYLKFFNVIFKPFKKEWFAISEKFGCMPKELLTCMFKTVNLYGDFKRPGHLLNRAWDRDFLVKSQALNSFFGNFQNLPETTFKQMFESISTNELINGKMKLLDQVVSLSNFRANLLTIAGSRDSFVPADSVRAIQKYISTNDFQYMEFPLGHLSLMGSERAKSTVWKTCVDWLTIRSGEAICRDGITNDSTMAI
jgi:polyhydroxyalkanoate synthase